MVCLAWVAGGQRLMHYSRLQNINAFTVESINGFEAETIKQANVNKTVTGAKINFSNLLEEAMFPRVLRAINAAMIHENIFIDTGIGNTPNSPAR
jgi:hypothetical protein